MRLKGRTAWLSCLTVFSAVCLVAMTGCPGVTPVSCTTDADCANVNNGVAICGTDGFCAAVDCVQDSDCTGDMQVCSSNQCVTVECIADSDCNTGEVCTNNQCVTAPECTTDADCNAGEICSGGMCVTAPTECTTDADCTDDGVFCNGNEVCDTATSTCVSEGDPCAGGTLPFCDETNDTCVECLVDADCGTGGMCSNGVCVAAPAECTSDADCADDGLFCNGTEFCDTTGLSGVCSHTGSPCAAGQTCDETTDTCGTPGTSFTLTTEDDALTGTTGDDTFTGSIGTLNPGDIVVGNGGTDTLNVTVAGATSSEATLIDIDFVNFTTLNATTFDALNCAAIGQFAAAAGSTGNLTLENLEAGAGVGMGNGYASKITATLADDSGAADEMDLTIDGTTNGAVFDYVQNTNPLETLNLIVDGSELDPAGPGVDFFGNVDEVLVTGTGDLTLGGCDPTDLAFNGIDTSDFDGDLTIAPLADNGNVIFNFTAGGLAAIEGIDNYVISDTETYNHTVTVNEGDSPLGIEIASIDASDLAGDVAVTQDGTESDDTINLMLGGEGDGMGAFTAASTEFLGIESGGTTANEIADVTINTGVAFVNTTVTVTGDQDIDLGAVVADIITASGFMGDLAVDNTGVAGENQLIGGSGDDLLIPGDDLDQVTGNGGSDTFGFDTIVLAANANTILDFVAGTDGDILRFDQTTFTEYDGSAIDIVDAASVTDTAGADNEVVVDTAANIAGINTSGGSGSNPIAIANDTGDIIYDADGNYGAASVVIGSITADQVDELIADNFDFP